MPRRRTDRPRRLPSADSPFGVQGLHSCARFTRTYRSSWKGVEGRRIAARIICRQPMCEALQWRATCFFVAARRKGLMSLIDLLLGCSHRRTTFPLTPAGRNAVSGTTRNNTYVVCLDCGKEFDYDWKEMRVGRPVTIRTPVPVAVRTPRSVPTLVAHPAGSASATGITTARRMAP
jgi:hypothetical protein